MSEEEKYDELIRQKFAEKEFIFNEANWEKAEAMIDASRKTKKIFWWSAVFLIGLICGIFLMFPLVKNQSSHTAIQPDSLSKPGYDESSASKKSILENDNSLTTHSSSDTTPLLKMESGRTDESVSNDGNPQMVSMKDAKENEKTSGKNPSANTASYGSFSKNKFAFVEKPDSKNVRQGSTTRSTLQRQKSNVKDKIANAGSGSAKSPTPEPLTEQENKTDAYKNGAFALANERKTIKNTKRHGERKDTDVRALKEGTKEEVQSKKEVVKKNVNDPADSTAGENKSTELLAAKLDALNDSAKQEEKKLVAADSIQKSDSIKVATQEKPASPGLDGLSSATFLSVDAGANAQLGWKNNGVTEARGITPVLGLGITHAFNQAWSAASGVYYNGIGYLKGDSKTSSSTTYDFGSKTTITTTKPHFLHYIAIPLTIQYHFNDKNAILAGASLSYLLNAKSNMEENITYVRPVDSLATENSSIDNSRAKVFNAFDAAVGIGYRRKISYRFSIIAIASFGLVDIKPNTFFLQNAVERNSGLKLMLTYNLFDF